MSKNIVFEGWLTKSPPSKRIWRTKWRRRWFALRQSGELPGQYFLDYYADRNYRRLKGTINLDLCEQVDAGLCMERTGNGSLDSKLRGSVFTIQTQSRTYHLEADCEADMAKWVEAICRACGLRSAEDDDSGPYQASTPNVSYPEDLAERALDNSGPYIPISECITGVRSQAVALDATTSNKHLHLETFHPPKYNSMAKATLESVEEGKENVAQQQPQPDKNERDSEDSSDDHSAAVNAPTKLSIRKISMKDYADGKKFARFTFSPTHNGFLDEGPPVPPRPPKTFAPKEVLHNPPFQGPKIQEPLEIPASPESLQYCNLATLPPAVDRNLKPRPTTLSPNNSNNTVAGPSGSSVISRTNLTRTETLQYLDLDLSPKNSPTMIQDGRKVEIAHRKSASEEYKTVDFLKTEAFMAMTMEDSLAFRGVQN